MKKVLVFGTFDGIHKGHFYFLKQAREYGAYLTIVVARDETVKKLKEKIPLRSEKERIRGLKKLKIVNEVILGGKTDPYKVLKKVKPDVICLGYDQKFFVENLLGEIKKIKLKTKVVRMKPYHLNKFHSSIINKYFDVQK